MRTAAALLIFLLTVLASAAHGLAEKRVALVIGNGAYKHAPALANPRNDAEAMAAALKRLKFEVIAGFDLDEPATKRLLRDFAEKLDGFGKEDVAVLFYAGHGLQVNGKNYLVPVDAKLEKERDLDFQSVGFDFIQQLMEKTAQTNIVILDSCRDNPLARTLARGMGTRSAGIGRGLAEMRGINDTLIVYATSPGSVALDGAERHSPFTAALLKHVEQPGLEVRHMISQVRAAVIAATKGKQVPWEAASLTRQVYFTPAAAPGATPAAPTPGPAPPPAVDQETVFWQSIKDSKNVADYRAYLARYPQGAFAELAKIRIAEIQKAAVMPPAPAKPDAATPQRTSTFEPDIAVQGEYLDVRVGIPTTRACQAFCLNDGRCVGWLHAGNGNCLTFATFTGRKRVSNADKIISGVIRTVPTAAPAPPPPKAQPAPATDRQSVIRELIRKGQANAKEDGLCSRIPWKHEGWSDATLERRVGEVILMECGIYRIDREYRNSKGILCKELSDFFCAKGGGCAVLSHRKFCRFGAGSVPARPGQAWDFCYSDRRPCD